MSTTPSSSEPVVCKPTKWFIWRAVAMLVMFSVFALLFLKDGIWGYKEKNEHYYYKQTFDKAGTYFQSKQDDETFTETEWEKYATEQKISFPDEGAEVLPAGTDLDSPWPSDLIDGYALMKQKGGQAGAQQLWEDFTKEKSWDAEVIEKAFTPWKIREQFVATAVAGLLIAVTLFFLIRTMRRKIVADDEALHTQDGRTVPYSAMTQIDKRKWDTKGIALVNYKDGGDEKTAKIDGMVYGQFNEEDGAPAEKLFAKVMSHFKGEVIEYEESDDDEEEEESLLDK